MWLNFQSKLLFLCSFLWSPLLELNLYLELSPLHPSLNSNPQTLCQKKKQVEFLESSSPLLSSVGLHSLSWTLLLECVEKFVHLLPSCLRWLSGWGMGHPPSILWSTPSLMSSLEDHLSDYSNAKQAHIQLQTTTAPLSNMFIFNF